MSFRNLRKFFRKHYRDVFGTSITGTTAAQLRAMREKKGWSQQELAEKVDMGQARISLLENPNYENLSLKTLKRIANIFDVALVVRFAPFSRLFAMIDSETSESLAVPGFVEEFGVEASPITTPGSKVIDISEHIKAMLAVRDQDASGQRVTNVALTALSGQKSSEANPLSKMK